MKKRLIFSIVFIITQFFSTVYAQKPADTINDKTNIEEKELVLQDDGKVHLYIKRSGKGVNEQVEREYKNFEDAKEDEEFNLNDINQIETLSEDLSYDKNKCLYTSIRIIESSEVGVQNAHNQNRQSDYKLGSQTSEVDNPGFKVDLPENMPEAFRKFIKNDLEVSLLDYFPNPANGNLTFHIGLYHQKPLELVLVNEDGREVYQKNYPRSSENIIDDIALDDYKSGVYLLIFRQKNKTLTRKLLIE